MLKSKLFKKVETDQKNLKIFEVIVKDIDNLSHYLDKLAEKVKNSAVSFGADEILSLPVEADKLSDYCYWGTAYNIKVHKELEFFGYNKSYLSLATQDEAILAWRGCFYKDGKFIELCECCNKKAHPK